MGIRTMFEVVRAALSGRKEEAEGVVLVNPADGTALGAPGGTPMETKIVSANGVTIEVNEADLANVGAQADAPAASDAGAATLISLVKRSLQNWTALLPRLPSSLGIKTAANSLSVAPASDGVFRTEPLGRPEVARQLAAGAASANVQLTAGVTRLTICARGADIRFAIGVAAPTAAGTSHYLAIGERMDIAIPSGWYIAAIRAGTVDGTLEITELV